MSRGARDLVRDAKLWGASAKTKWVNRASARVAHALKHYTAWVYLTDSVAKIRYDINPPDRVLTKKKDVVLSAYPCNLGVRVQADTNWSAREESFHPVERLLQLVHRRRVAHAEALILAEG